VAESGLNARGDFYNYFSFNFTWNLITVCIVLEYLDS